MYMGTHLEGPFHEVRLVRAADAGNRAVRFSRAYCAAPGIRATGTHWRGWRAGHCFNRRLTAGRRAWWPFTATQLRFPLFERNLGSPLQTGNAEMEAQYLHVAWEAARFNCRPAACCESCSCKWFRRPALLRETCISLFHVFLVVRVSWLFPGVVLADADGPHADLFRALRGGGGGTYGAVVEFTIRIHPFPKNYSVLLCCRIQ